jgi:hypothetical protein
MEDDASHPMDSPAPILAAIGVVALVLLITLMTIDAFWQASGPAAVASPASTQTAAPAKAG